MVPPSLLAPRITSRVERFAEGLHGSVGARKAVVDVAVGAAEIDELAGIVLHGGVAQQRLEHRARKDRADGGAVLRRDAVDVAGRLVAAGARHVLHHDGRLPGNYLPKCRATSRA